MTAGLNPFGRLGRLGGSVRVSGEALVHATRDLVRRPTSFSRVVPSGELPRARARMPPARPLGPNERDRTVSHGPRTLAFGGAQVLANVRFDQAPTGAH